MVGEKTPTSSFLLTHPHTHRLRYSLTQPLTQSPTHSLNHLPTHSFICLLTRLVTDTLTHSQILCTHSLASSSDGRGNERGSSRCCFGHGSKVAAGDGVEHLHRGLGSVQVGSEGRPASNRASIRDHLGGGVGERGREKQKKEGERDTDRGWEEGSF